MSRRPSQQPTIAMPAVDPDPEGELPTNPTPQAHERPTLRPSADGWTPEPVVTYDRARGAWALATPYDAEQRDKHGNTFLVHCQPDLVFRLGNPTELRADVVAAQLAQSMASALVIPFTGESGAQVDSRWRLVIVQAFREGDRGDLARG